MVLCVFFKENNTFIQHERIKIRKEIQLIKKILTKVLRFPQKYNKSAYQNDF